MAFGSWHGRGNWDSRLRWVVGHLDQGVHVENKADPAIAENSSAGQQVLLAESVAETLDHDFLFAEKLIHKQTPGKSPDSTTTTMPSSGLITRDVLPR